MNYVTHYNVLEGISSSSNDLTNCLKLNHDEQKEKKQLHYNVVIGNNIHDVPKVRSLKLIGYIVYCYIVRKFFPEIIS